VVAGVGARELTRAGRAACAALGAALARGGHVLRTGGSPGADQAFAHGAATEGGAVEVVLPWAGFAAGALPAGARLHAFDPPRDAAWEALARRLCPGWDALPVDDHGAPGARRRLLARNVAVVAGDARVGPPAALVIAVHAGRSPAGGTAHALRCAWWSGVPARVLAEGALPADGGLWDHPADVSGPHPA